jgi:hypothetical protein
MNGADIVKAVMVENGRIFLEFFTLGIMEAYWNVYMTSGRENDSTTVLSV